MLVSEREAIRTIYIDFSLLDWLDHAFDEVFYPQATIC